MISRSNGRWRAFWRFALAGCLLAGLPAAARSTPEVVALRGFPSAVTATYGPAVALPAVDPANGVAAVPTGSGIELFGTTVTPGEITHLATFRTAGPIERVAGAGSNVFLFAGDRGVIAVDAADPAAPVAVSSIDRLGRIARGAVTTSGGRVLAAGDSTLQFLAYDPASGFSLARTVRFADGRRVVAVEARSDSFLVASNRFGTIPRVLFTLYRFQSGSAAPESLGEFAFNGHSASDLAWSGTLAFVADGNAGVMVLNVATRVIVRTVPVLGSKFVRSVAATGSYVAAAAEGRTMVTFQRAGAALDSLAPLQTFLTGLEPVAVRFAGGRVVVSTVDAPSVSEPDEAAHSQVELLDPTGVATAPPPVGSAGRSRRLVANAGLAYVADYTGGLRIYRMDGADTSLVGSLPEAGNGRVVDVAIDPSRSLAYLAAGPAGLEVVNVRDPSSPARIGSLGLPGSAYAVTLAGPRLLAVGRRLAGSAGVTFVDVADSTNPAPRGSVNEPSLQDVRALAVRDTILFVADEGLGLVSIRFGDPDLPATIGPSSGAAARALDLTGTTLLVGTRASGLQVVDVFDPLAPLLRATLATPAIFGMARNGASAALFLGDEGTLVVDVANVNAPSVRGPIGVPGFSQGGAWIGDTLAVTASLGLERYRVSPGVVPVPVLAISLDEAGGLPRALLTWSPVSIPGVIGLNLYRDLGASTSGASDAVGRLVNRSLLPPSAVAATDDSLTAGATHRYRLEGFKADGSSVKVAEGSIAVPAGARIGRPFPNPYRPRGGSVAAIPIRVAPPPPGATVTLRVFDPAGRLVRAITAPAPAGGGYGVIEWDGKDARGRRVADGIFYLHVSGAGLDDARTITVLR